MAGQPLPLFNAEWYLTQNPDVRAAVERGEGTAYEHFLLHGNGEGRAIGPLFNPAHYLRDNPDVANAVRDGAGSAYDHFLLHGMKEGRTPFSMFDADLYLELNPDVAAAVKAGAGSAIEHLLTHGLKEGRPLLPFFNMQGYLDANPDVARAVAAGETDPLTHLLQYGIAEGRLLSNGVDLGAFAKDPVFTKAISQGRFDDAFARVGEVAPFLPTFKGPAGWQPDADTPIPQGFVPHAPGQYLVVPKGVTVPAGSSLPDAFGPSPSNGGGNGGGNSGDPDDGDNAEGPYVLTEGADIINGTDDFDTFVTDASLLGNLSGAAAASVTLGSEDRLDGKGEFDALYIGRHAYQNNAAPHLTSIEGVLNMNVGIPVYNPTSGLWENGATLDLTNASGIGQLVTAFTGAPTGAGGAVAGIYRGVSLDTAFGAAGIDASMNASLDLTFSDDLSGDEDILVLQLHGTGGMLGVGWNGNLNTGIEHIVINSLDYGLGWEDDASPNSTNFGFADYATVETISIIGWGNLEVIEINTDTFGSANNSNTLHTVDAQFATANISVETLQSTNLKTILTGSGNDFVVNNGQEGQTISTGDGNDTIHLGVFQGGHTITTCEGEDVVRIDGPQLSNIRLRDGETGSVRDNFESAIITITDFNGSDDFLHLYGSLSGARTNLGTSEIDSIASADSLYDALKVIEPVFKSLSTVISGPFWTKFQYDGNTYIYEDNGDGVFGYDDDQGAADGLIELLNFTGDLHTGNFSYGDGLMD